MNRSFRILPLFALVLWNPPAQAKDADGCKDPALFSRMPGHYIDRCNTIQFAARNFPVGPAASNRTVKTMAVEGPFSVFVYRPNEGTQPPSPLQIQRNFQAAAKKAGASLEGSFGKWCQLVLDESWALGNGCTDHASTFKFKQANKEVWVFVDATSSGYTGYRDGYTVAIVEREAMTQDIVATDLLEKLSKDGFVSLYFNFETGSATLDPASSSQLDEIAAMLKATPALSVEVGGHTDNVGDAAANMKLSAARAASVVKELTGRGIAAGRLLAKGYGQTQPIADNRLEEGRAKNRRVELVKR